MTVTAVVHLEGFSFSLPNRPMKLTIHENYDGMEPPMVNTLRRATHIVHVLRGHDAECYIELTPLSEVKETPTADHYREKLKQYEGAKEITWDELEAAGGLACYTHCSKDSFLSHEWTAPAIARRFFDHFGPRLDGIEGKHLLAMIHVYMSTKPPSGKWEINDGTYIASKARGDMREPRFQKRVCNEVMRLLKEKSSNQKNCA